jgi:hypothetical protein
MSAPLDSPGPHRQRRLRAVERLALRRFIDAQHQGTVGRVAFGRSGGDAASQIKSSAPKTDPPTWPGTAWRRVW